MDLYLFRLSLKAREAPDLFEAVGIRDIGREAWLRHVFGARRPFRHYNGNFAFLPETEISQAPSNLIFGWIGRETRLAERTSPSEGFEPTEHLGWQAAFVVIDPTHHDDGQRIAIESNDDIGKPRAILNSLVKSINADPEGSYFVTAYPLISENSFWDFAKSHHDKIKSITFDVAVPNMFNSSSEFEDELRSLRDKENVAEVKTTLESDGDLAYNTERMKDIVNYVERGAGELSAEASDGARYSSTIHEKRVQVEVEHHTRNLRTFLRDIVTRLDRIF